MRVSVFVGASVDGFIARKDDSLDWLPADGGEPHGYVEFMATVDALVIGRRTYDVVLGFSAWPYGEKRVVVLSSEPIATPPSGAIVDRLSGDPSEILARLAGQGVEHVYLDGGITIQRFLRAGLVHRIVVTRVPTLIGEGIPLFGSLPHDVRLRHVATRTFASGLVQTEYHVDEAIGASTVVEPLWLAD